MLDYELIQSADCKCPSECFGIPGGLTCLSTEIDRDSRAFACPAVASVAVNRLPR